MTNDLWLSDNTWIAVTVDNVIKDAIVESGVDYELWLEFYQTFQLATPNYQKYSARALTLAEQLNNDDDSDDSMELQIQLYGEVQRALGLYGDNLCHLTAEP